MRLKNRWATSAMVLLALAGTACANGEGSPEDLTSDLAPPPADVGVVLETMMSSGYTYARVAAATEEIWVAGPGNNELAQGDTVLLVGADNMGVFHSEALDRTFQDLYFVGSWVADPTIQVFEGTVLETMNVAGYTYVQVEVGEDLQWMTPEGSEDPFVWLAGPESEFAVGDMIQWQGGSVMQNFHSSTLDRTFEEILFVGEFTVAN